MARMGAVRRERLSSLVPLPEGPGLEIGPLADPIVGPEEPGVRYVDVTSQQKLRAHYLEDPNVDCDAIPPIDFTLTTDSGVRNLADAVSEGAPYRYAVACHVIEHVPDVIKWLADLGTILDDNGVVWLVIPDKRYCFDYYRQQTSVGQMLQAFESKNTIPSTRAVYDHFRDAATVLTDQLWRGVPPADLPWTRIHPFETAVAHMDRARLGEYIDCHVWTFTPTTFVQQIVELLLLGLCHFRVEAILATPQNSLEFSAVLRRLPRDRRHAARQESIDTSLAVLRAALSDAPAPVDEHRRGIEELRGRLEELRSSLSAARAEVARQSTELSDIKSSQRWQVGGAIVTPAKGALTALRAVSRGRSARRR